MRKCANEDEDKKKIEVKMKRNDIPRGGWNAMRTDTEGKEKGGTSRGPVREQRNGCTLCGETGTSVCGWNQ
jgi:hypothetical protein